MTGRVRLVSNELADRATAEAVTLTLQNLLDPKIWSIIYPNLKSADDGFHDYPMVRRSAVAQALALLTGERDSMTKPILVSVLRHSGLFKGGSNAELRADEVFDDETKKSIFGSDNAKS